jgi:hypothetical protein
MRPLSYGTALASLTGLFGLLVLAPSGYLYHLQQERREQAVEIARLEQIGAFLRQKQGQFDELDRLLISADSVYRIQQERQMEIEEVIPSEPFIQLSSYTAPPPAPEPPIEAEAPEEDEPVITYRWATSLRSTIDTHAGRAASDQIKLTLHLTEIALEEIIFRDTTGLRLYADTTAGDGITLRLEAGQGEAIVRARHLPTGLTVERGFDRRYDHDWTIEQLRQLTATQRR